MWKRLKNYYNINLFTNIIMYMPLIYSTLPTSTVTPYPSNRLNKSTNFKTMFDTTLLPYNKMYNGTKLCYNVAKGTFIYKPHTDVGNVGRTSAGYLFQRKRV